MRMTPVAHICSFGLSTAATSSKLNVLGYKNRNETKFATHTAVCTPGTDRMSHSCAPVLAVIDEVEDSDYGERQTDSRKQYTPSARPNQLLACVHTYHISTLVVPGFRRYLLS